MRDRAPRAGWMAEFPHAEAALDAARRLRALGYRDLETYSPYPVPEADEVLELPRPRLLPIVGVLGFLGAGLGWFVMWYANVWDYPLDVGGRPLHPVPAFVPIVFESGILAAGVTAFVVLLVAARLGRLWRPEFEVEGFESVSADRFWVAVGAHDPRFERERTRSDLAALQPLRLAPFGAAP